MQYHPLIDVTNDNTSHAILIRLTGRVKNVLDVGCARGYLGDVLVWQFNCTVSGIEVDPDAAHIARQVYREVVVGNVEDPGVFERLQHRPFDVIIFGDVLEHLRQPEQVLAAAQHVLRPHGYVLVSLPNVVTLRLRIRFLRGQFEYTDQGIMDRTHLRFYTLKSAREMIRECGYTIDDFDFVVGPRFGRHLRQLHIPRRLLPATLLGTQFIFKAHPSGEG